MRYRSQRQDMAANSVRMRNWNILFSKQTRASQMYKILIWDRHCPIFCVVQHEQWKTSLVKLLYSCPHTEHVRNVVSPLPSSHTQSYFMIFFVVVKVSSSVRNGNLTTWLDWKSSNLFIAHFKKSQILRVICHPNPINWFSDPKNIFSETRNAEMVWTIHKQILYWLICLHKDIFHTGGLAMIMAQCIDSNKPDWIAKSVGS